MFIHIAYHINRISAYIFSVFSLFFLYLLFSSCFFIYTTLRFYTFPMHILHIKKIFPFFSCIFMNLGV
ncbi:hypothetical protein DORFOR_00301 [Dorea formicigenerans ATCC 27755]|uniref:Uncharacterized protein n=1 Tax=Dorea formicigenerans ATCC 27755 TaxID=411461 RepID=B0G247_9FIRM|nr:hypothetical protein DORFOR_00301 [Dorea formicigenerans ATCC 27755]